MSIQRDEPRFIGSRLAAVPMRKLPVFILSIALLYSLGCESSRKNFKFASQPSQNAPSAPSNSPATQNENPQILCSRVSEIKTLPYYPEEADDPAFIAIVKAGDKVIPCLIEKVGDTTSMQDPRMDPRYAGIDNKVGDVALWVLEDITHFDVLQFLPRNVQADFKEEGVLAYFKYVRENQHRRDLQNKLYEWYHKKYGKDAHNILL